MKWLLAMFVSILFAACGEPPDVEAGRDDSRDLPRGATSASDEDNHDADTSARPTEPTGGIITPGVSQLALYKSGSRIRARVAKTPDGAQAFMGWFDSQIEQDCTFLSSADGVTRCLPGSTLITRAFSGSDTGFFSDSQCQIEVGYTFKCTLVATGGVYGLVFDSGRQDDICGPGGWRVVRANSVQGDIYGKVGEECIVGNQQLRDSYEFFSISDQVSLDSFVEVTMSVE